jgi:hypothetical protein
MATISCKRSRAERLSICPNFRPTTSKSLQASDAGRVSSAPPLCQQRRGRRAIEVLIFPPAMKGTSEGRYPWDLKPKSTMTNGTILNAVKTIAPI